MPKPARAPAVASKTRMVGAKIAAQFWSAVEDCLVTFHDIPRHEAAQKITTTWKSLAELPPPESAQCADPEIQGSFQDIIYHAEPWYIACNLANEQKDLAQNRTAYQKILRQYHLG